MPIQDADIMNGLLGKVYKIMMSPDTVVPNAVARVSSNANQPPFVCFASPGIAVDTLDFGNMTTTEQVNACSFFSDLVNAVPASTGVWRKSSSRIQDIYRQAITNIDLPDETLKPEEQDLLKKAEGFLREEVAFTDPFSGETKKEPRPTAAYQMYEKMFTAYAAALRQCNNARLNAILNPTPANVQDWAANGANYEKQVRIAYEQWGSVGFRDYVEKANAIISQMMGRGSYAQYERLRQTFALAEKKDFLGQSFYPTFANPPKILGTDFADAWTKFTFSHSEIQSYQNESRSSWGGGASAGWGLWSASGSYQRTDAQTYYRCNTSGLSLSVELIQVPIVRGWCEPWIFSSRGWKGRDMLAADGCISDGGNPPNGLMPLFPTSLILARNLQISMDMTSTENQTSLTTINSGASGGWGPFTVRGNYASSQYSASAQTSSDNASLSSKGAQIIGFVCDVLPKSPNHDPQLKWGNNPAILSSESKSELMRRAFAFQRWLS